MFSPVNLCYSTSEIISKFNEYDETTLESHIGCVPLRGDERGADKRKRGMLYILQEHKVFFDFKHTEMVGEV